MKEKLIVTRNFLYRLFVIGFVFNVLFQLLILLIGANAIQEASKILELQPYYLIELIISTIICTRIFLVYFILFPAVALHWTVARDKMFRKTD